MAAEYQRGHGPTALRVGRGHDMRIMWISTGLCLALLVVFFGVYEPGPDEQQSANADQAQDVTANPFAGDEPGTEDTNVKLAALPASAAKPVNNAAPDEATARSAPQVQDNVGHETDTDTDTDKGAAGFARQQIAAAAGQTVAALDSDNTGEITAKDGAPSGETDGAATKHDQATRHRASVTVSSFLNDPDDDTIAVIVHSSNQQSLSSAEIRAMYMDKLTRWNDGSRVTLYNLPLGDQDREKFSKSILEMTALEADKLETQRREQHKTVNPVKVKAKNIVVSYIERHPHAIGYVPLSEVNERSNVRVLMTIPAR